MGKIIENLKENFWKWCTWIGRRRLILEDQSDGKWFKVEQNFVGERCNEIIKEKIESDEKTTSL